MTNKNLAILVDTIKQRGEILESDILNLRRAIGADFKIDAYEADALFELNGLDAKAESWNGYFIEAISNFLIHMTPPEGYISEINAAWLIARIEHDGVVESETELQLLLNVMRYASNVTDSIEKFALEQVKQAVLHGKGYIAKGRQLEPGVIGEAEVEILKRVIYAVSSEGGISITKVEAEMLYNLNEACTSERNHESWQRLFVGAMANHLMMAAAWEEDDFQNALRREEWFADSRVNDSIGNAFKTLKTGLQPKSFIANLRSIFERQETDMTRYGKLTHMDKTAARSAERITPAEATWLIERLNRDGILDSNEIALLKFLEEECPDIHDTLKPLIKAA